MTESVKVRSRARPPSAGRARPSPDSGRNGRSDRIGSTERLRSAERRLGEADELPAPPASGHPLQAALLNDLSRTIGRDLSRIRLHHDWFAAELTEALDAQAVTHGNDVYLGTDTADPSTPAGRALLVHELFHSLAGGATAAPDGGHHEEDTAERAGLAAGRSDLSSLPLTYQTGRPSLPADSETPDDAREATGQADRPGRRTRLGLRAKATLTRRGDKGTADVVSAGDALVRLVDRLFGKDPDDRGGRLTAVLGRLEPSLRDAVVTAVVARNGGHAESTLPELARESAPQDGGYAEPATEIPDGPASESAPGSTAEAEAKPEVAAGAESAEPGQVGTAEPEAAVSPESAAAGADRTPTAATAVKDAAEAGETGAVEQPPAVATLDVPTAEQAPSAAAAPAVGPGIAPGGPASAPEVPSGGEAPAAAAEPAAGEAMPGAEPAPGEAAPGAGPLVGERAAPEGAQIAQQPVPAAGTEPGAAGPEAEAGPAAEAGQAPETVVTPTEAAPAGEEAPSGQPTAAEAAETAEPTAAEEERTPEPEPAPAEAAEAEPAPAEPAPAEPAPAEPAPAEPAPAEPAPAEPAPAEPAPAEAAEAEPAPAEAAETETAQGGGTPAEAAEGQSAESDITAAEPGSVSPGAGEAGTPEAAAPALVADTEPVLTEPSAPSGGGGGGGGGGAAIADRPEPAAPDVSGMEPQAALGAAASLPVTRLASSLTGVSAAARRTVADARADLAANPPSMERPSGVPADKDASLPPAPLPPLPVATERIMPLMAGGPGTRPPTPAAPPPAPAPVTLSVPDAKAGGDTQISAEDAARIQGAVKELPTTDPALDVTAGPVPELELSGSEEPKQVTDQAAKVEDITAGAQRDGLADARADMGENDVSPQVPKETLTADVSGGEGPPAGSGEAATAALPAAPTAAAPTGAGSAGAGISAPVSGGAGGGGAAAVPAAAIDAVAAEQGADQVNASTQTQAAALGAARQEHMSSVEQAKADTDRQINEEIANNGAEQTQERRDVRTEVGADRKAWASEQDKIVADSRQAAGTATKTASQSIDAARSTARTDAAKVVKDGNDSIAKERSKAEETARERREKAEKESESGGFFSWLGSKVKSFFDGIKKAIHDVFDLARKAVDLAIKTAQKLAVEAIEIGRKAVVAAIELGGKALAAAGDIVLAGFPEARDRFRKKIADRVASAKKTVNELADKLKAGVKMLLDGLGKLLKGALTLMEKAYTAAIDVVAKVVDTVIKAAKAFIDALLDFAVLVADIASNPVQWLRNLGSSLLDGVRNHVWPSLVSAVKDWFKSKVEEVIGVGKAILDVLRNGGITFGKIVTMAWTAIKESLPGILIQLLIEKLVAMLIPAAGALSMIIDGIKAAWAAASRILAALQKFIAFLKAVKAGNAGPKFGELVGAVAVAVMDFLANFVLSRLKGAGQKVGGTLRKMAERFMKAAKKVAGAVKKGAKAAAGAVRKGLTGAVRVVKKGVTAVGRTIKIVLPKNLVKLGAKAVGYVGKKAEAGLAKVKSLYQKGKQKLSGKGKPKKPLETKEQKTQRAIDRTRQTVSRLLAKGVSRPRLWATLKWLKIRWGWKQLERKPTGNNTFAIVGAINPEVNIGAGISSMMILHSGGPVLVGSVPVPLETPKLPLETPKFAHVSLGSQRAAELYKQYPAALIQPSVGGLRPARLAQIGEADIGRPVIITMPEQTLERQVPGGGSMDVRQRRTAGGASTLSLALLNVEMTIRKGGDIGPFVRPDVRTTLVPGVDPLTGKHDPSRDSVHLYEITTMTSFVDGNKVMTRHKQQQAIWTIDRVLNAYRGAKVHYTFISPGYPDEATRTLIQQIITGLPAPDAARFTVTWRTIGYTR